MLKQMVQRIIQKTDPYVKIRRAEMNLLIDTKLALSTGKSVASPPAENSFTSLGSNHFYIGSP